MEKRYDRAFSERSFTAEAKIETPHFNDAFFFHQQKGAWRHKSTLRSKVNYSLDALEKKSLCGATGGFTLPTVKWPSSFCQTISQQHGRKLSNLQKLSSLNTTTAI